MQRRKFMKVFKCVLVLLFVGSAAMLCADQHAVSNSFSSSSLRGWQPVSGSWRVMGGKLVQTDTREKMAMINIPVHQEGVMMYQFDLEYRSGGEDDYAGFGIHICVNNPTDKRSWGNGRSVLGWVTWDPEAYGYPGAFIHVYESMGQTDMNLHEAVFPRADIMRYGDMLPVNTEYIKSEYLNAVVPIRIMLDTRTGEGRFYDPFDPDRYYYPFDLGTRIRPGDYFSLRTNSVSVSIDNLEIRRVR
jgi:hypothetical protein